MKSLLVFCLGMIFAFFTLPHVMPQNKEKAQEQKRQVLLARQQAGQGRADSLKLRALGAFPDPRQGIRVDQRIHREQIEKLKKVSEERSRMIGLHDALQQGEDRQRRQNTLELRNERRLKLFGKETRFHEAPAAPKRRHVLMKSLASNVLVNGRTDDSVLVGEDYTITFSFAPGALSAIASVYVDTNGDGAADADDILLGQILLLDNDANDLDLSIGAYKVTIGRRWYDILTEIVADLVFQIDDYQAVSSALVKVRQEPTPSVILATILPQKPFVACIVENPDMVVFTDSSGKFQIYLDPVPGDPIELRLWDFTGVTNGSVPPAPKIVYLPADTIRLDLSYSDATEFIEGYVTDQYGSPVVNALVEGSRDFRTLTYSDSTGYYRIGVDEGNWEVDVAVPEGSEFVRDYSNDPRVWVPPAATVRCDITLTRSNSAISGTVTFNGAGVGGVSLYAHSGSLSKIVLSNGDGSFSIPVYSSDVPANVYSVECFVYAGYFVENPFRENISPGTAGLAFMVRKVAGGLQGRITDANSGEPIRDAYVEAYGSQGYTYTWSNDSGYYRMSLLDGTYSMYAYATAYFSKYEYNVPVLGAVGTMNIALVRSGTFSGTVKDEAGFPLQGAEVFAYDSTGGWYLTYSSADATGAYVLSHLSTGKYKALARRLGFVQQWYAFAENLDQATTIQVTEGFNTPGIDFILSKGGSLSGKVTDKSGSAIVGVWVTAYDTSLSWISNSRTDDSGAYTITGLPTGRYLVEAYSYSDYLTQWYDKADSPVLATHVNVVINEETSGVDFILAKASSISGTVKTTANTTLSSFQVTVFDSLFNAIAYAFAYFETDYTISPLPAGRKLYVQAKSSGYSDRWYDNVGATDSATTVVLEEEEKRTGIDFVLPLGGSIAGTVLDAAGSPIPSAGLFAYDTSSFSQVYSSSDQNGEYSLTGLPRGGYFVHAYAYGYVEQWFDHAPTIAEATGVPVIEETVAGNINFNLHRAAGISGAVIDVASGEGISGAYVEAFRDDGYWYTTNTSFDGSYMLPLDPGGYVLRASDPLHGGYLSEYFAPDGGTPVRMHARHISLGEGESAVADFGLEAQEYSYSFTNEKLGMTITNFGQLGYWQDPTLPSARWPASSSPNNLFEGDMWFGGTVYGDLRVTGGEYQPPNSFWKGLTNYHVAATTGQKGVETWMSDVWPFGGITVRQDAFSWDESDFAIYEYTIRNQSPEGYALSPIQNAFVGFFMDFDISDNALDDKVGIVAGENLAYMYDSASPDTVGVGVCLLSEPLGRLTWWANGNDPRNDTARYSVMAGAGSIEVPDTAGDYRVFVSAGPFNLDPGDSVTVTLAVVAGYGLAGILQAANEARTAYVTGVPDMERAVIPATFGLLQNYPNPFNPTTTIQFDLPERVWVKLEVFDILGRSVALLVDEIREAGRQQIVFDAQHLSSGVYLYRLNTPGVVETKRMILLR